MKHEDIIISTGKKTATLPNSWRGMTPGVFRRYVANMLMLYAGTMTETDVKVRYVLDVMGWRAERLSEDGIANVVALANRITFLFTSQGDGTIVPDLNFMAQMVPVVKVGTTEYKGYEVSTAFCSLTTTLTALQYIEARQLMQGGEAQLPLLAAVLYCPGDYDSARAQRLATEMARLDRVTLAAIQMNFVAFDRALYTQTDFSLLAKFQPKKQSPIATDMADALYDLSADGLGTHQDVERMNLLTYLRIMRKKTIEAVRQMRSMEWDVARISQETTLPVAVIHQIID